jgi:hypothetical protein
MRVRESLDFDILIGSFISLCIIETVGAIYREYKRTWQAFLSYIIVIFCIFGKMGKKSDLSPECQKFVKKLCIIETVGAIFREYKPWIVLLITQWSKSSKILALWVKSLTYLRNAKSL